MKTQVTDITKEEIEAGFISPEMVEFEDRFHTDKKFAKMVEIEAYADLYDILFN